jgi:hypothetical protein
MYVAILRAEDAQPRQIVIVVSIGNVHYFANQMFSQNVFGLEATAIESGSPNNIEKGFET